MKSLAFVLLCAACEGSQLDFPVQPGGGGTFSTGSVAPDQLPDAGTGGGEGGAGGDGGVGGGDGGVGADGGAVYPDGGALYDAGSYPDGMIPYDASVPLTP